VQNYSAFSYGNLVVTLSKIVAKLATIQDSANTGSVNTLFE